MITPQQVQIPLALFTKIVEFFEYLNISKIELPVLFDLNSILSELHDKQNRINMRTAYTNIVTSKNDGQRRTAYYNYSKLKKRYHSS